MVKISVQLIIELVLAGVCVNRSNIYCQQIDILDDEKPRKFLARVSCNDGNGAKRKKKCYGKNQRCHTHCQKMKMNGKKLSKF